VVFVNCTFDVGDKESAGSILDYAALDQRELQVGRLPAPNLNQQTKLKPKDWGLPHLSTNLSLRRRNCHGSPFKRTKPLLELGNTEYHFTGMENTSSTTEKQRLSH
jgi:hypothetical protein